MFLYQLELKEGREKMKEWYCLFRGRKEGPYSFLELKRHPRLTPDTLVWKKGFHEWVRAGQVRELQKIFKDEKRGKGSQKKKGEERPPREVEILDTGQNPGPSFWIYVLIVVIVLLFIVYSIFF